MYDSYTPTRSGGIAGALRRAEGWLDDRGRTAWIAAMVLGFVIFWPVGLALLAYMIWSKRMSSRSCTTSRRTTFDTLRSTQRSSGNSAFDAYKAETLRRLQDEQEAFEAFLQRLRDAKDKTEFDAFMADRARANTAPEPRIEPRDTNPAAGY
jgi:heme/copper-type cytochrome/quinol oxidase subunit 1